MIDPMRAGRLRWIAWAACLAAAAGFGGKAWAGTYSQLIVFGDSLSDVGNDAHLMGYQSPSDPGAWPIAAYPGDGRFSNGPIWVDDLAGMLGVADPKASLLGGTNYAYGFAQTGSGDATTPPEFGSLSVPNLLTQVGQFTTSLNGSPMDSHALVAVWAGANDFMYGGVHDLAGVQAMVTNVMTAINTLYDAGGRNFLVGGLPPLGEIPAAAGLSDGDKAAANLLSLAFSNGLADALAGFEAGHSGTQVGFNDVYTAFNKIIADPTAFGLTNVTDPALFAIQAGQNIDPNKYLFWDTVHPTTAGHALIAQAAFQAVVPEPSSLVLAALGGLGVAVAARRRAA